MILSELLPFLQSLGIRPKKSLSQNFLIDANIVRKIVATAAIQPGDSVLEIGSGPGALTAALLQTDAHVYAIEKDRAFAQALERLQTKDLRLNFFHADALTFPLDSLPCPLKVVANLPYHITTPLLEILFAHASRFSTLTLMVQKEFGERLLAKPGTPHFSSLALFTQFHTTLLSHFHVSASCFYPRPSVDSTVLHFALKPSPLKDPAPFFLLTRRAFQQKRKMLRTSLKSLYPQSAIDSALSTCNLPLQVRPEVLSLEQWLQFFELLDKTM